MWSRFKKRFFGGSRKTADDSSSLDETIIHACVLTDADDVRKSRQTLRQFAKDDLHAVSGPANGKPNPEGSGVGGGGKLKRKLSWFGGKSRRTTKSMTSLNSDKRRSGDDAVVGSKAAAVCETTKSSTVQPLAESSAAKTGADSRSVAGGVVDSVVRITSSKTSSSLLVVDKTLLASRDDVWCSRVEFTADKGTFGASSTSRIEELQRPVSLPVACADTGKASPPKLKRRAKAASQSESETRKSRLSKSQPESNPALHTEPATTAETVTAQV